jgi:predicted nuclease with TOPRIM domain
MDDDLKAVLGNILTVVESTRSEVTTLRSEVTALREDHGRKLEALQTGQDAQGQHLDRVETELRQVKEMVGSIRLREVARLDGRIDQLAQDVALSRRAG